MVDLHHSCQGTQAVAGSPATSVVRIYGSHYCVHDIKPAHPSQPNSFAPPLNARNRISRYLDLGRVHLLSGGAVGLHCEINRAVVAD